jgi:cell wall-associated NlpC family hydrolase
MQHDWTKYIGIPFRDHGRDFTGCDCYGLVRLALLNEFGVALPLLIDEYEDPNNHDQVGAAVSLWRPLLTGDRLGAPEAAAIAVILVSGHPAHVGLCIDDRMILHSRGHRTGSLLHRIDDPFFKGRIEGYYRVR